MKTKRNIIKRNDDKFYHEITVTTRFEHEITAKSEPFDTEIEARTDMARVIEEAQDWNI